MLGSNLTNLIALRTFVCGNTMPHRYVRLRLVATEQVQIAMHVD